MVLEEPLISRNLKPSNKIYPHIAIPQIYQKEEPFQDDCVNFISRTFEFIKDN